VQWLSARPSSTLPAPQAPAHAAQGAAPFYGRRDPFTTPSSALDRFRLADKTSPFVLHLKRLTRAHADRPQEAAVSALRDSRLFRRDPLPRDVLVCLEDGTFSDSCLVSAQLLKGGFTTGLLIAVGCSPSAAEQRRRVGTVRGDEWDTAAVRETVHHGWRTS